MASKKDLVEGQSFSRRRLVTAFVSGAPGGREVEPGKPLRAVVGGVLLSAVLCVGALAVGLLAPTLPDGWDKGSLVIAEDTGARYAALDGTLYPVVNTTSARLLVPSGFTVVSAASDKLTDTPRGPTVGIVGAPDALPAPASLTHDWAACTSRSRGVLTTIGTATSATAVTDQAVVVQVADGTDDPATFLVDNGFRYAIPAGEADAVRRNLDLVTAPDLSVTAAWINLFRAGPDLAPFAPAGAGTSLAGVQGLPAEAGVGSVVRLEGTSGREFLLLAGGRITQLTPFAAAMYRLDPDVADAPVLTVPSLAQGVQNADPVWPDGWPSQVPTALDRTPCAVLSTGPGADPGVALGASVDQVADDTLQARVGPGEGSLVRGVGSAAVDAGPVFLVDQTGMAFPVLGSSDENPVGRLGYAAGDVVPVPLGWLSLLAAGPELSVSAARTVVAAASGP